MFLGSNTPFLEIFDLCLMCKCKLNSKNTILVYEWLKLNSNFEGNLPKEKFCHCNDKLTTDNRLPTIISVIPRKDPAIIVPDLHDQSVMLHFVLFLRGVELNSIDVIAEHLFRSKVVMFLEQSLFQMIDAEPLVELLYKNVSIIPSTGSTEGLEFLKSYITGFLKMLNPSEQKLIRFKTKKLSDIKTTNTLANMLIQLKNISNATAIGLSQKFSSFHNLYEHAKDINDLAKFQYTVNGIDKTIGIKLATL